VTVLAARAGLGLRGARGSGGGTAAFIAGVTLLVGALALCINRVHNGDVYLELSAGRFISQHGLVGHDPFPTIAAGREWLNQQWLAELVFYNLARVVGMTGLTLLYALLLGLPLSWLLWRCRRKGVVMLAAGAVLYFPTVLAIVHPRAAVFTLAAFSCLVVLLLRGWPATLAIPGLFALWANLHGGFVSGLVLIGLVGAGMLVEHRRRARSAGRRRPVALLGLVGAAALGATFATPLGPDVWEYVWSFRNPAISLATQEWAPAFHSPLILVYVLVAGAFAGWVWARMPRPRPLTPILVAGAFVALTLYSQRNVLLLGPVMLYVIASCAPDRAAAPVRRGPALAVGLAAAAAAAVWGFALGPARTAPYLKPRLVDAVLLHPPKTGRIASIAGVGSYLLWRSERTPVVINGWLEHYTSRELRGAYTMLLPGRAGLGYMRAWNVGGVITRRPATVRWLRAHGFRLVAATSEGTYLARAAGYATEVSRPASSRRRRS
jgi:hypothetical protein